MLTNCKTDIKTYLLMQPCHFNFLICRCDSLYVEPRLHRIRIGAPRLLSTYHLEIWYSLYFYANQPQLYLSLKHTSKLPPSSLSYCLSEVKAWFSSNCFKLNSSKTETYCRYETIICQRPVVSLCIDGSTIAPSRQVKSLGVILDNAMHNLTSFLSYVFNLFQLIEWVFG